MAPAVCFLVLTGCDRIGGGAGSTDSRGLPRAEEWRLRSECSALAERQFERDEKTGFGTDWTGGFDAHYNASENRCYVEASRSSFNRKTSHMTTSKTLHDAQENTLLMGCINVSGTNTASHESCNDRFGEPLDNEAAEEFMRAKMERPLKTKIQPGP